MLLTSVLSATLLTCGRWQEICNKIDRKSVILVEWDIEATVAKEKLSIFAPLNSKARL